MNVTKSAFASAALLGLFTLAAGCASETTESSNHELTPPGDPTSTMSAEGLAITESSKDHVAGRFERGGVALRFDFTREGERHHATVSRDDGAPIFDSVLVGSRDTTVYFGGRATAKGEVTGEAEKSGDETVFEELESGPEGRLVPQLKEALIASRAVDHDLFRLRTDVAPSAPADLAPLAQIRGSLNDGWHVLSVSDTYSFWSWSFWGTTNVVLGANYDWMYGVYYATFQAGAAGPEYINGAGAKTYSRNWWGGYVTVSNRWLPLCSNGGCQDTTMWVRAY